jgi:DNA-binding GntR family transcriptional regulator
VTPALFAPVAAITRRDQVVRLLRSAILTGRLRSGQQIVEAKIAAQMQVSRGPLREAMRELVQEGLLVNVAYSGTYVLDVTVSAVEEAYSLNKLIEIFAVERSWLRRAPPFFTELDHRHEAVRRATRTGDTTAQIEAAIHLHSLVYEAADHALLLETWRRLSGRLQMYFAVYQQAYAEPVPSEDIHNDYVAGLKGNDLALAKRSVLAHIDIGYEDFLQYVREFESSKAKLSKGSRTL